MFNSIMKKVNRRMAGKKEAFTLVEILVVILIIGLLFVFLVPKISSATDKARETGIKTDMHSYQVAFESVVKEKSGLGANATGSTATDSSNLITAVNSYLDPALAITVDGTTATKGSCAKTDPWNNNYKIMCVTPASTNNGAIMVYSMGKDSKETAMEVPAVDATSAGFVAFTSATGNDVDNYALVTEYVNGVQYTETTGFSTNIVH